MKIAWVTPFNTRSAIARVSAVVTAELVARGHEVTIVRSEFNPDATTALKTKLPMLDWRGCIPEQVEAQHDAVVAQIGDNHDFHAGAVDFIERTLCLGIFHDFCIYHLFQHWVHHNGRDERVRLREIDRLHGKGAGEAARPLFAAGVDLATIGRRLPMTDWLSRRCGAAFAHANFYRPMLEEACPGPVGMAYLTQEPRAVPALPQRSGEIVVTTIGWINANKCADTIIRAIAGSPALKAACRYRIVGPIAESERQRLAGLAAAEGFAALDILGEVDEATLDAELARADIFCCLRRPALEGASASAIEALMAGRPTIVADAGFYAELPAEHVAKVPADAPVEAVRAALESLAADEPRRRAMGAAASRWAQDAFSRTRYVDALERFTQDFVALAPHLRVARAYSRKLSALGLGAGDPALARIADRLQALFAPERA